MSNLTSDINSAGQDLGLLFRDEKGETGVFGEWALRCSCCGRARRAQAVVGKFSAKHVCNAKCLSSHSHKCECSCGGKNHGASYQ